MAKGALQFVLAALAVGLLSPTAAAASKILVYPMPWQSRVFDLVALSGELAHRGHEVLLVTPAAFADKVLGALAQRGPPRPLTNAGAGGTVRHLTYPLDTAFWKVAAQANPIQMLRVMVTSLLESCYVLLGDQAAVDTLFGFEADLFIGDMVTQCSWTLADLLKLPRVDYTSGAGGAAAESGLWGLPMPLAFIPSYGSALPPTGMNLPQRAVNVLSYAAILGITKWFAAPSLHAVRRRVNTTWPDTGPLWDPSAHRAALALSGTDLGVELPRPLPPHVKYVGPLLPRPPRALPPDLEAFVSGAGEAGVVVAAFGSFLNLPPRGLLAIARAFAALPQRVVWKVAATDVDAATQTQFDAAVAAAGNIAVRTWLPQQDLLGHPAVKCFLSHGGIHSMYEAIYHGVPLVMVPLGADQFDNARLMEEHHGASLTVSEKALNAGNTAGLTVALGRVISEPHFKDSVTTLSARLKAHPGTPLDRAADWVEYVLVTAGEPHLWSADKDLSWIQLALLDVAALGLAATAAGVAFWFWLASRWLRRRQNNSSLAQTEGKKRS